MIFGFGSSRSSDLKTTFQKWRIRSGRRRRGWQHRCMPAPRVTAKTKIFQIEIVLEEVQPQVRRRVLVPGEVSLAVLHEVVQAVVGWTTSHLHEFEIDGRRYGMSELGVHGDDQPGPAVRRLRGADLRAVQPRVCLSSRKVCSMSKRRRNPCHQRSTSAVAAPVAEVHNQTGFGARSPGRCSTCSPIRVPSMTGSSPSWSSQQARRVSRGWTGSQLVATAVP